LFCTGSTNSLLMNNFVWLMAGAAGRFIVAVVITGLQKGLEEGRTAE
jgi:hypothetical protein